MDMKLLGKGKNEIQIKKKETKNWFVVFLIFLVIFWSNYLRTLSGIKVTRKKYLQKQPPVLFYKKAVLKISQYSQEKT